MLSEFLESLFDEGEVSFRVAPPTEVPDRERAREALARAFHEDRLEIAGPLIDLDGAVALAAAEFVWRSCWFLVHRDSPAEEVGARLKLPPPPRSASHHLSADLTFRHLPQLHRRARTLSPDDVLTRSLVDALRGWPLAGVASDIEEPPTSSPDFEGHPGLQLLYAERYVRHPRPAWLPAGRITEYVELITKSPTPTRVRAPS